MNGHTPGPWRLVVSSKGWQNPYQIERSDGACLFSFGESPFHECGEADARLIAAAPTQHAEMLRYLPILERAESDPELWGRLTEGTGIATLNGYRAAIAKATGEGK